MNNFNIFEARSKKRKNILHLLSKIRCFLSYNTFDERRVFDFFESMNRDDQLFITRNLINSDIVIFFYTKKFEKTEQFKEEWGKRENKVFLVVLLEELDLNSNLDLSQYFVFNFYESLSLEARKEIIKEITARFVMLTKVNSNEMILSEVIVKTSTRENIEKIMIMNYAKATVVGTIANGDIEKHEFCWIKHLNQIFCYQKKRSKFIKEANCSLFSKTGNLIKSVFSTDNSFYEVNSIFYNKNNLQVYLNVLNKQFFKRSILALNEEFNLIKIIDEDLFNSDYPLNYSSEIKFFNIDYKMFHYNSNIAFLQY